MGRLTAASSEQLSNDCTDFDTNDPWQLLSSRPQSFQTGHQCHDYTTAPIVTHAALNHPSYQQIHTQYGLLGQVVTIHSQKDSHSPHDPRVYINTNAPFSAIVCGVQGSGKSHTVSILLENMLISGLPAIGSLNRPLSGLVLHYGEGGPGSRPSEAAFLAATKFKGVHPPPVKVYVPDSALNVLRQVYAPLGEHVVVEPLRFMEDELDAQAFLSMMSVGSSASAPLYIQTLLSILRDLGENFTYHALEAELDSRKFNPAQMAGLDQRMALLRSFMVRGLDGRHCPSERFAPGQLTIVDLSDPFIDPTSASSLFEIIVRLFVRADVGTGKVLLVDEAHKYLSPSHSSGLTQSLLRLVREQRHLAMRVVISTQEPTAIPPVLLDLCNVSIMHRFSSPAWWEHLTKHVSTDFSGCDVFNKVIALQTGEALILAPSALCTSMSSEENKGDGNLEFLGRRYMIARSRRRVTADGGASILVLDSHVGND